MRYYILGPEVAGGFGANTQLKSSCHPPKVDCLHLEFEGWLGDCLIESFPCFVATESVIESLKAAGTTGIEDRDVEVSTTDGFRELYPDREIGRWRWMQAVGTPGLDDIAVTESARLVASERAVEILRSHGLEHCDIEEYNGEQVSGGNGGQAR